MTFMELIMMSNEDQAKWISEHSYEENKALFDEWMVAINQEHIAYQLIRFRERRKMCEISNAILKGNCSGVTCDGKHWRIDFSDPYVDDWRDQYYHGDYD